MCRFERALANVLLKEDIPRVDHSREFKQRDDELQSLGAGERLFLGAWRRLKSHLSERQTWTGVVYLFLRFPTGIASFVLAVVLISVAGSLLGAPAYFWVDEGIELGVWQVDVLWEAIVLSIVGIPAVFMP